MEDWLEKLGTDIVIDILLRNLTEAKSNLASDDTSARKAGIDTLEYVSFLTAELIKILK